MTTAAEIEVGCTLTIAGGRSNNNVGEEDNVAKVREVGGGWAETDMECKEGCLDV